MKETNTEENKTLRAKAGSISGFRFA